MSKLGKQFEEPTNIYKIRDAGMHFFQDHFYRFNSSDYDTKYSHDINDHIVGTDKSGYHLKLTNNQAEYLHDDAADYASGGMVDDADKDLVRSAKSVHKSMGRYFE